jgi:hypothetical protein
MIDTEKNTVSVKAPDAAAFWAMIMTIEGVPVDNDQVISAKDDKNKYKFSFDKDGNLISVAGDIVTLRCTATDSNGNTGVAEATLPDDMLKSLESMAGSFDGEDFSDWHRNYPNPFTQSTTIEFMMEKSALVNVYIIDQVGGLVERLESRVMPTGINDVTWDASKYNPGMYFYRIEYEGRQVTGKMSYIKH